MAWREYVIMASLQFAIAGMHILSDIAFNRGLSFFILITYRHAIAALTIAPFAYFLERKKRPALTLPTFCQIFMLALVGITFALNLYFAALRYTSPTFVAALTNAVPVITLIIAVILRLEKLDAGRTSGQVKLVGILACIGGAVLMAVYKGPALTHTASHVHMRAAKEQHDWTKGCILGICSCFCWGFWYVVQATAVKRYPAQLSLAAIVCSLAAIQSAIATAIFERHSSVWVLHWDVQLLTVVYSGVLCSGIAFFLQFWCASKRGPLFVVMFNPLLMIIVAVMAALILGQSVRLGIVLGAVLIVGALYCVLWGKHQEAKLNSNVNPIPPVEEGPKDNGPVVISGNDGPNVSSTDLEDASQPKETIAVKKRATILSHGEQCNNLD